MCLWQNDRILNVTGNNILPILLAKRGGDSLSWTGKIVWHNDRARIGSYIELNFYIYSTWYKCSISNEINIILWLYSQLRTSTVRKIRMVQPHRVDILFINLIGFILKWAYSPYIILFCDCIPILFISWSLSWSLLISHYETSRYLIVWKNLLYL